MPTPFSKKKPKADEKKLKKDLTDGAKKIKKKDVEELLKKKKDLDEKIKDVPGRFKKMINQVKLLFEMIGDYWRKRYTKIPWTSIATAVFAILYFLSPVDLIPDFIPVIGYVDDAAVVALAVSFIQEDLKEYCKFKGYRLAQYF